MPSRHGHGPLQPRHEKAKALTPPSLPSRSSSSTSSAANHADYSLPDDFSNFRLNPSLLARNRATPSTPVVNWISLDRPSHDELACPLTHPSRRSFMVSARKIAANVWDFHQDTPYVCSRFPRNREKVAVRHNQLSEMDSSPATSCVTRRSHTRSSARNNKMAVLRKTTDSKAKAQLTDASSSSPVVNRRASRRFVKMLNQISDLEDKNTCSIQIVSALNMEINHASEQVEELLHEQKSYNKEVQKLSKGLSDKRIWPREGQDDVTKVLWFIKEELEAEKNSRKRLERLYRKAAEDIIDLKATLARTLNDLEKERRGRELLEVVFDELAREAGDVESVRTDEVTCQSAERKAQMQARTELEDKSNGLEKLRIVLKAFLQERGEQWKDVTRERHQ